MLALPGSSGLFSRCRPVVGGVPEQASRQRAYCARESEVGRDENGATLEIALWPYAVTSLRL